jgi:hypothetical protein
VVTVQVLDESGDPVPGLLMGLVSDNPYLQDGKGEKAAARIEVTIPTRCWVRFAILDIEGEVVQWLVNGEWVPGVYSVAWDGTDDDGARRNSGRYTAAVQTFDLETDELLAEGSVDMLMCILDPVRKHVGVTDEEGRIVLLDWKLFPQLYDREPMTTYDETGEAMGELQPTNAMIFTFADTLGGGGMTFRRDVPGPVDLEFVWASTPAIVSDAPGKGVTVIRMPPGPTHVFKVGPVYPNPFN